MGKIEGNSILFFHLFFILFNAQRHNDRECGDVWQMVIEDLSFFSSHVWMDLWGNFYEFVDNVEE
jgi:hypothetical protein